MRDKDSMTAKELASQKFEGIAIAKPYGDLLGKIELSAIGFIWGENFSGKSTLALGIANAMAVYGRVEYVPAEEDFGITLTNKINRIKAYNGDLHFRRYKGLKSLKEYLIGVKAKVVFLDSISVLNANDQEVVNFAQWCRDKQIGMWMIAHANKDGSYKGSSKFAHEADIRIEVLAEDNTAHSRKNRYDDSARSIKVPFEVKASNVKRETAKTKRKSKKHKSKSVKKKSKAAFDAQMDEVEQLMANVL